MSYDQEIGKMISTLVKGLSVFVSVCVLFAGSLQLLQPKALGWSSLLPHP